jgi:uncharacterized protein YjbI with pentapeptide repeats
MSTKKKSIFSVRLLAALLGVIGIIVSILDRMHSGETLWAASLNLVKGVTTDFVGLAFTVLVIDWLNERNAKRDRKERLIRELSSKDNGFALHALVEITSSDWLADGSLSNNVYNNTNLSNGDLSGAVIDNASLAGANFANAVLDKASLRMSNLANANFHSAFLSEANLSGANLTKADFSAAILHQANFEGAVLWQANLRDAKLIGARWMSADLHSANFSGSIGLTLLDLIVAGQLRGAVMPDGSCYDGRFRLSGDIKNALERGIDLSAAAQMADFYGVSLEAYAAGQRMNPPQD